MANKTLIIKMDPSATFTGGSTASSGIATYNNKIITGVGAGNTNLTLNFASSKISSRTFNKVFNINVKNKYEAAKSELQALFNEYTGVEAYIQINTNSIAQSGGNRIDGWNYVYNCTSENINTATGTGWSSVNVNKGINYALSRTPAVVIITTTRYYYCDEWAYSGEEYRMWYTFKLTAIVNYDIYSGISAAYDRKMMYSGSDGWINANEAYMGYSAANSTITNVRFKNSSGSYINYDDSKFSNVLYKYK